MTPAPLSLSLSCAGSAILSSAYYVCWLTRKNVPTGDLPPEMDTNLSLPTRDPGIAYWFTPSTPSPTMGTWNPSTTYALGDTVAGTDYRFQSADHVTVNVPIVYRSLVAGNKGHKPELWDGKWTCVTQPPEATNSDYGVAPVGYLLDPLPTKSALSTATWKVTLWQSLFWTVPAPGDVVQLIDQWVQLNYLVGSAIVSTISRPLTNTTTTSGSGGQITNPGVNAQIQCWHTSGLASFPTMTLNGFDLTAFVDGMQPGSTVGSSYLSALAASGGTPPYTFAIIAGSLPPGVTLNFTTGVISGTPGSSGIFDFTAQVTDSAGATATATCAAPIACGGGGGGGGIPGNAFY